MTLIQKKKQWVEELKHQLSLQTEKGRGSKKDITTIFNEYLDGLKSSSKMKETVLYKKYTEEFERLIMILDYINGEGKFEELK